MVAPRPGGSRRCPACLFWLAAFIAGAYGVCGPPPPPLNNTVSNEDPTKVSYETDSIVTYICDEQKGYVQSPGKSSTITCLSDGSWSEIQEFCERSCKLPPRLQFGEVLDRFINRNVFPVGTIVTYQCRPGYVIKRGMHKTVTCLDTLQWTEIQEFCDRKDCGNPGELPNGDVQFQGGDDGPIDTKFGSTVTFVCNPGFRILGRNQRRCTHKGWDNAVPNCETVICPKPPDIENGMHTSMGQEEFQYQTGVTYSCNSNTFSLIGEASIHCTENGTWSGSPPKCKVISCPSPHVPNAARTSGFGVSHTFKDSVGLACNAGFVMNGSSPIECGEDNQWHPPVPFCQPVSISIAFECKMPSIAHGEVIMLPESSNENKKNIEISCATLYVIHGESRIHCIEEKNQWHPSLPECHLSQGFVAAIIILVLIIILVVVVCLYWYNKKKQGHYPTNEKDGKAEAMQLKDSNHAVDA